MGWSFYISFSRDTGVSLFNVKHHEETILYELGLQEALAHYAGARSSKASHRSMLNLEQETTHTTRIQRLLTPTRDLVCTLSSSYRATTVQLMLRSSIRRYSAETTPAITHAVFASLNMCMMLRSSVTRTFGMPLPQRMPT